jgi:hypothetical protein
MSVPMMVARPILRDQRGLLAWGEPFLRALLQEGMGYVVRADPWRSVCADGDRLSGLDHAVEHVDDDGDLSSLAWQGPRAELGADQMLVSAHGGLSVVAAPVLLQTLQQVMPSGWWQSVQAATWKRPATKVACASMSRAPML